MIIIEIIVGLGLFIGGIAVGVWLGKPDYDTNSNCG